MECGRYFHRIGGFRRNFSGMARDCGPDGLLFAGGGFTAGAFSYLLSYLSGRRQSRPSGMDLAIGLVLVLAALLVAVKADQIIGLIPMVMGAVFAINGAVKLQRSVELKQVQYRGWGVVMFYAILTIGFGVLLLFNPFSAATDDGSDFGNRAFGQRRYGYYNHDECFPADSEGHAARSQLVQKGFFLKKERFALFF